MNILARPLPRLRRIVVAAFLAGAAQAGLAGHHGLAQLPPGGGAAGPGIPVTVAAVTRQDFPILLRNIGAVQAFQSVMVR